MLATTGVTDWNFSVMKGKSDCILFYTMFSGNCSSLIRTVGDLAYIYLVHNLSGSLPHFDSTLLFNSNTTIKFNSMLTNLSVEVKCCNPLRSFKFITVNVY